MDQLWLGLQWLFGAGQEAKDVDALQVCFRAVLVYFFGWAILRIGGNRFLGQETAFDIVLGFVLGSVLSRAINGSSTLLLAVVASALLVGVHHLLTWITFKSQTLSEIFKGRPRTLLRDGEILPEEMRRHQLSDGDLDETLRLNGRVDDLHKVKEARFERNGKISVVKKESAPRVVEVRVEAGVQTVRIEIG
ncbi:MAG TPA: YetF domain-containing protein [Thermoanaerobaculia bacterium]|nr:YetF domain-containing protein [Thermoanaerobaculia bacterium]